MTSVTGDHSPSLSETSALAPALSKSRTHLGLPTAAAKWRALHVRHTLLFSDLDRFAESPKPCLVSFIVLFCWFQGEPRAEPCTRGRSPSMRAGGPQAGYPLDASNLQVIV